MRRYAFLAILFIVTATIFANCDGVSGYDTAILEGLIARVKIMPDEGEYPYYNTLVGFYNYHHSYGNLYKDMDWVTCNGGNMSSVPTGEFSGWLTPINGEEFIYTAYEGEAEAVFGVRLKVPRINGISEGDQIETSADFAVAYTPEDGKSIQVWCEDDSYNSVTAGEQDDNGVYEGLDTTALSGPGHIRISRFYQNYDIYDDSRLHSAELSDGEMVNIVNVVWVD